MDFHLKLTLTYLLQGSFLRVTRNSEVCFSNALHFAVLSRASVRCKGLPRAVLGAHFGVPH